MKCVLLSQSLVVAILVSFSSVFLVVHANAKNDIQYIETKNCASAKVLKGDTCSNAEVEFEFSACSDKSNPIVVKRMICAGQTIKARATVNGSRIEAIYKKVDDGWGSVKWLPQGSVRTWTPSANQANASETHPTSSHIHAVQTLSPQFTTTQSHDNAQSEQVNNGQESRVTASEIMKKTDFSGFFDLRHTRFTNDNPSANLQKESGFLLEDAAVYASFEDGSLKAVIDLPFARNTDSNDDSPNFDFATVKGQAYARYTFFDNMTLQFGQFDTLYGLEVNDSKDRFFSEFGLAYSQTLPVVHSGAVLEYALSSYNTTFKLLAANPSDRGSLGGANDVGDNNHEYGLVINYSGAALRGQLGYLTREKDNLAGSSDARSLIDVLFGFNWQDLTFDIQYSVVNEPTKDTLTTDSTDEEDAGSGLAAIITYAINDKYKVGLRYESITDDPGSVSTGDADSVSASIHYVAHSNLTFRFEYDQFNMDPSLNPGTHDAYDKTFTSISGLVTF